MMLDMDVTIEVFRKNSSFPLNRRWGDEIYLQTRQKKLPSAEEFEASLDEAQKWAASVGYQESDVNDIVKFARKKKRA